MCSGTWFSVVTQGWDQSSRGTPLLFWLRTNYPGIFSARPHSDTYLEAAIYLQ